MKEDISKKFNTEPISFERTGKHSFMVEHDDGSIFQGKMKSFPDKLAHKKVKGLIDKKSVRGVDMDSDGKIVGGGNIE